MRDKNRIVYAERIIETRPTTVLAVAECGCTFAMPRTTRQTPHYFHPIRATSAACTFTGTVSHVATRDAERIPDMATMRRMVADADAAERAAQAAIEATARASIVDFENAIGLYSDATSESATA